MRRKVDYWGSITSRRTMLRGAAGAATLTGLAALAAACGGSSETKSGSGSSAQATTAAGGGTAQAAGQPKRGGTIEMATVGEAPTLDPHVQTIGGWFINPMYNGLLRINGKLQFDPELAESFTQEDNLTYVFKLRKGVKFQDVQPVNGREMKAADVKYSWQRMSTDDPIYKRRTFWNVLDKVDTPDDDTVVFKTKEPYAPFISYVANPWSLIVAKEVVDKFTDLQQKPAGTGPWIMTDRQENVATKFKRNPTYFRQGMPYADNLVVSVVPERATQVAAFRSGKIDYITLLDEHVTNLRNDKVDVQIDEFGSIAPYYIRMNIKRPASGVFKDQRVRQAVMYAADPAEMIKAVFGGAGTVIGPIPPGHQQYALAESELPKQDLQKAKQLLAAAGFPNGFDVSMSLPSTVALKQRDCGVVLKGQLAKAGINANVVQSDWASFLKDQYAFNYELAVHSDSSFLDPDEYLYQMFHTEGARNLSQVSDAKLDALLQKTRTTVDPAERAKVVKETERYLLELVPYAYLLSPSVYYGYSRKVQNWQRWYFGDNGNLSVDQWWLKS